MIVGPGLPAAGPDELVGSGEPGQTRPGVERDAMEQPIDEVELPRDLLRVHLPRLEWRIEAEQADHAVDVDGEQRLVTLLFPEDGHGSIRLRMTHSRSGPRPVATIRRRAEHESARPQGANPQVEEDVDS